MNMKAHILAALREQFNRWEELVASLSEAQITAPQLADNWSIKDVFAHLLAWQQRSNARMEAALNHREPEFPRWPAEFDPEAAGEPDQLNHWLYASYRDQPWPHVYGEWRAGFLRLLEAGEAMAEKELLDAGEYPWLEGRPLAGVLLATYDHHQEHLDILLPWLQQHQLGKAEASN